MLEGVYYCWGGLLLLVGELLLLRLVLCCRGSTAAGKDLLLREGSDVAGCCIVYLTGCWESIVAGVDLLTLGGPVLLDLFYCLSCYH